MDYSNYTHIEFRRKFWKLFGASITMVNPADQSTVGFITMKAWKLREDITVYSDARQTNAVMTIKARQILDFGATYDVTDAAGQPIVSLQRKALRSAFVRDHWKMLNAEGQQIGYIQETSSGLALARRYLGIIPYLGDVLDLVFSFIPETYRLVHKESGGEQTIGSIVHRKNPFIVKMGLTFEPNETGADKRIGVAATALLSIMDATKN